MTKKHNLFGLAMGVRALSTALGESATLHLVDTLLYVAMNEGCTAMDIRRDLSLSKSTTGRNLDFLCAESRDWTGALVEGAGLVEYQADPEDRRRKMVKLSAAGRKLIQSITSGK